ncbi:MAG TPA: hypothetical protein PLZ32_03635 [Saprospiraceae bacterium]|nr:hypothetical protein [Saprospiraceae bacterium]
MNRLKLTLFAMLLACFALPSKVSSQCQGPFVSGNDCNANYLPNNATSVQFILGGGYYFSLLSSLGEVYIVPGPGVSIYEQVTGNTYNDAAVLPLGTDVSALPLMGFSSSPLFMYHIFAQFGPWGQGTSGYLGVMTDDGRFGYVDLRDCGELECQRGEYHFIVNDSGISEVVQPGATTGECASLLIDNSGPIPTMGQWGIIILLLILVIFGTQAVKSTSRTEQSFN